MLNCDISRISRHAQVFYHNVVDNSAYPNVVIEKAKKAKGGVKVKTEEVMIEGLTKDQIARLLHTNVKELQEIATDTPYYKQYRELTTQAVHTVIKDGRIIAERVLGVKEDTGYTFSAKLHALAGVEGKNQYFLEIIAAVRQSEGMRFGLGEGDLSVSIGFNDYELAPIETSGEVTLICGTKEHCFYPLNEKLIASLVAAKNFSMSVTGGIGNVAVFAPTIGSGLSFSNYWKNAINLLENGRLTPSEAEASAASPVGDLKGGTLMDTLMKAVKEFLLQEKSKMTLKRALLWLFVLYCIVYLIVQCCTD